MANLFAKNKGTYSLYSAKTYVKEGIDRIRSKPWAEGTGQ